MPNKEYRPTLAQMRTFVTIAEQKHFGTAATKLGISQPSLSQALVALEQGLGLQLIERSTRRVIITSAGMRLLPYAKTTLEAADAFLAHAQGAGEPLSGPLSLGIIPTAAPYILNQLLSLLAERFPHLQVRIVEEKTENLALRLRDGSLDVALMAIPSELQGLEEIPLYREGFSVVLPETEPLANKPALTIEDLGELNLLLLDDGHCLRDQVIQLCRSAHLNIVSATDSITRATSLPTIIQLVAGGLGATLLPNSAVPHEAERPGVKVKPFKSGTEANRLMGLVYRNSSARAEEFTDLGNVIIDAFDRIDEA